MNAHRNSDTRLTPLNVGPIPDDWDSLKIGQVAIRVTNGYVGPVVEHQTTTAADKVRYLQGFNVRPNRIELINESYVRAEFDRAHPKSRLKEDDVLTVQSGHIGTTARVPKELEGSNCHALIITRPNTELINSKFLTAYLNSHVGQARMRGLHVGSSIVHINTSELVEFRVPVPPLLEQRKIADILTTWDEALEKLDALIEAKERRKKALMQQLLTGKKRMKGFSRTWTKVQLGDVAENVAERNKGRMGSESLYAVMKSEGMIPMREHVKGESFDRCKPVETDWFAYNPMRINIGSIARWKGKQTVMVSGDYVVFRCLPGRLLPAYLDHLRHSWMWRSFVTRGGNGSVRVRIYFNDLGHFTFLCPSIEEQRQIANILDTADQELTLLRAQRAALVQQKRGLMQRLLTGKLRVKP